MCPYGELKSPRLSRGRGERILISAQTAAPRLLLHAADCAHLVALTLGLCLHSQGEQMIYSFQIPGIPMNGMATITAEAGVVPEPATMLLVGIGLVGAAARRKALQPR